MKKSVNNYDIIIKNGKVVDGTGNPWFKSDIGILEDKIAYIGKMNNEKSKIVIDASGLFVCPGFIDVHSHADLTVMQYPGCESSILQGVTTSVVGNCGWSLAPINDFSRNLVRKYYSPILQQNDNCKWDWNSFRQYYNKITHQKINMNLVPLVGHGTIRMAVKGFSKKDITANEIKKMQFLLRESLEDGAFGISVGLGYPPGGYVDIEELIKITKILKEYDAILSCHIRDYGRLLEKSILEIISVGEKNEIPILISHLLAKGEKNWNHIIRKAIKIIEKARKEDIEIYFDRYPYTAGCSIITQLLPMWTLEGGIDIMLNRLRNKNDREKIKNELVKNWSGEGAGINEIGFNQIFLSNVVEKNKYEGKSLEEIMVEKRRIDDPYNCLMDIILELEGQCSQIQYISSQKDIDLLIVHPLSMIMSDSWLMNVEIKGKPHPRNFGTFPKFLSYYVKKKKLLNWEEAIRKITSMPATAIRLKDRGLIKEGFFADITIFNPNKICDTATYQNPKQYPLGVAFVIVNGKLTVQNGNLFKKGAGLVLRKK